MKRASLMFLEIGLLVGLAVWVYFSVRETSSIAVPGAVEITMQVPGARDKVVVYTNKAGDYRYIITLLDGQTRDLSGTELTALQVRDRTSRSWGQKLLNISDPFGYIWVGLGFLGQVLFTGRMIVQWLVSEKRKQSVVPPVFWWMSLIGSSMLMVYFMWRRDPIGLLGQAFGWFIYIRNLWMIYRPQAPHSDAISQAEAQEAAT